MSIYSRQEERRPDGTLADRGPAQRPPQAGPLIVPVSQSVVHASLTVRFQKCPPNSSSSLTQSRALRCACQLLLVIQQGGTLRAS
jgi:hypothetical protein